MKIWKLLAVLLVALLCLTACGAHQTTTGEEGPKETPFATPDPENGIPPAVTNEEPTKEGETYQTTGMYIGMADNNLLVIIEQNPVDGQGEKSYQISSDFDLDAMGITEGSIVNLEYAVDDHGVKRVTSISVAY